MFVKKVLGRFMRNKLLKIVIGALCIYFTIVCFTPNVMSQIGKSQAFGLNAVPEIDGYHPEWEWPNALDTFGAHSLKYKEEYLKEDVLSISLLFYHNSNDIDIGIMINLSESDKVRMGLGAYYDYEEKELTYNPVYILQGESSSSEEYTDEKSIDEYLNKYGLTRQDVERCQEYAIYDVIVKTWTKAHLESYWLERWKLKLCKVTDNTFQFEEESQEEGSDLILMEVEKPKDR